MSTIDSEMLGDNEHNENNRPRRDWTPPAPEVERRLSAMIRDIGVAMLTTVAEDGTLRSRPMASLGSGLENGEVWFFTSDDSGKVAEIDAEHEVNLAFSEPKDQRYISLSGVAEFQRDPDRARRLWTAAAKAWFPKGPTDPHLMLMRVRVRSAEYWDAPAGAMVSLFAMAESMITGQNPTSVGGDHGRVTLGR